LHLHACMLMSSSWRMQLRSYVHVSQEPGTQLTPSHRAMHGLHQIMLRSLHRLRN